MIKLSDLQPQFVKYEERIETYEIIIGDEKTWRARGCPTEKITGPKEWILRVDVLEDAQGIWFDCPICKTHRVQVTFADRGVKEEYGTHGSMGQPTRWTVVGTDFSNLTTSPSILFGGGCNWHGYINNGNVSII